MKKEKSKKRKTIISLMLLLYICVIGVSYAVYNYTFTGNKSTLETAGISLEFLESNTNIITIENALPMGCIDGKNQTETFDFAVTSKTTRDINIKYSIYIETLELDSGYSSLDDYNIAVYLTDYSGANELLPSNYDCRTENESSIATSKETNTKNIKPILLANNDNTHVTLIGDLNKYKLYTGVHTHNSTHETVQDKFKLRAWIAGDVDASNWNSSTKLQYKFKLKLKSEEESSHYVYRHNDINSNTGDPIDQRVGNKWIVKVNGEESEYVNNLVQEHFGRHYWNTHEECTNAAEGMGYSEGQSTPIGVLTCGEAEVTYGGIGTYTTDYQTLNKDVFLKHNLINNDEIDNTEVCFIKKNDLYCIKGGDSSQATYEKNKLILDEAMPALRCNEVNGSSSSEGNYKIYRCYHNNVEVEAYSFGYIYVNYDGEICGVGGDGSASCYTE